MRDAKYKVGADLRAAHDNNVAADLRAAYSRGVL